MDTTPTPARRSSSFGLAALTLVAAIILSGRAPTLSLPFLQHAPTCGSVPAHAPSRRPVDKAAAQKVVLVTDGSNFDDLLTLLYLAKSPALDPVAVFIAGNAWANAAPSRRIMRDLLHLFGRYADVPLLMGAYYALADVAAAARAGHPAAVVPAYRATVPHGMPGREACDDAFGAARLLPAAPPRSDSDAPATDRASIDALARALAPLQNGSVLALVTGTLTPLALLLQQENEAARTTVLSRLSGAVVMGGAVHVPGNMFSNPGNRHAEFNIYNDPHAAQVSLEGLQHAGVPVTLVPLDATRFAPVSREMCAALEDGAQTPEAQWAGSVLRGVARVMQAIGRDPYSTVFLWDVVAAVVASAPEVVKRRVNMPVRVVTEQDLWGAEQGRVKQCNGTDDGGSRCADVDVVLEVDGDMVAKDVLNVFQSRTNSARQALVC